MSAPGTASLRAPARAERRCTRDSKVAAAVKAGPPCAPVVARTAKLSSTVTTARRTPALGLDLRAEHRSTSASPWGASNSAVRALAQRLATSRRETMGPASPAEGEQGPSRMARTKSAPLAIIASRSRSRRQARRRRSAAGKDISGGQSAIQWVRAPTHASALAASPPWGLEALTVRRSTKPLMASSCAASSCAPRPVESSAARDAFVDSSLVRILDGVPPSAKRTVVVAGACLRAGAAAAIRDFSTSARSTHR
mmetsp:Transcript_12866/g.31247  ORF Transcript_12866/g.31247 Transcript_12866/m.31247 type:complete len:254 (+) Transcript_12866:574-1335(+)